MSRAIQTVAVVVIVALMATPAMATPATVTIDASDSVQPGETVTVTLNVTNTGGNASGYLLNVSLPDGWTVANHTDDGARWQANDTEWVWLSIDPGDSRHPSLELTVPSDSANGTASITAPVADSESVRDTAAVDVTVEDGDSGGDDDGGSGDDDSSDGGSDDSSDDDSSDGGSDDSSDDDSSDGGSDDGSDSSDSSSDNSTDSGSSDHEIQGVEVPYGDVNTSSESDTSSFDRESNTTEAESEEPTETAAESADESATPGTSDTEADDGTAASDTGNSSNTAVGVGLSALVILAAGVGMVTVRRDVVEESLVDAIRAGSQTEPETASTPDTGDSYGGADIEVRTFHVAPDKCIITYATKSAGNKEIGDEIREIARNYASADSEDIQTQRLEATVQHGEQTVATWHIPSELLDELDTGVLTTETFEQKVLKTLSFDS